MSEERRQANDNHNDYNDLMGETEVDGEDSRDIDDMSPRFWAHRVQPPER